MALEKLGQLGEEIGRTAAFVGMFLPCSFHILSWSDFSRTAGTVREEQARQKLNSTSACTAYVL